MAPCVFYASESCQVYFLCGPQRGLWFVPASILRQFLSNLGDNVCQG